MVNRPPKTLSDDEKKIFTDLEVKDITLKLLQDLFANRWNPEKKTVEPSRFETYDEFKLSPNEFHNKEAITTNCGLYIVNKFLLGPDFIKYTGYINDEITKKRYGKLEHDIAYYILTDESGELVEKYFEFLDRLTWLVFTFHSEICASKTIKSMKPLPKVMAEKEKMLKKYDKEIKAGDVKTAVKIQNDLTKIAEEELKDDPSYELYKSGARGAFDNAYRQAQIMKGPVYNGATKSWDIMTNSLYDGATKKDLPTMANAIVQGVYPKSIGTGECGYLTKKLAATFQSNVLDDRGSDCGSKALMNVKLTDKNSEMYFYQYIVEGSKFIRFDPTTKSKYVGKTVKMRLPTCCTGKKLCNRCAGDRYYMLGIMDIGLTNGRVSNSLLRARMKQAHDATVRIADLPLDELYES